MGTSPQFLTHVQDSIPEKHALVFKKMFGEYAVYYEGKMIAMLCDNCLFVKSHPSIQDRFMDFISEGYPYPNAKVHFRVDFERLSDTDFSSLIDLLIEISASPKKKK